MIWPWQKKEEVLPPEPPHEHLFTGSIEDGYQYCLGCGEAIPVQPIKCTHLELDPEIYKGYQKCIKCSKAIAVAACPHIHLAEMVDSFQRCEDCGKLLPVKPPPCHHEWEEKECFPIERLNNRLNKQVTVAKKYVFECKRCKTFKSNTVNLT